MTTFNQTALAAKSVGSFSLLTSPYGLYALCGGVRENVATGNCPGYHSMIFCNIMREELELGSLSVLDDWHASTPGISRIYREHQCPLQSGDLQAKAYPIARTISG
jgi:glucokinase